MAPPRAFGAAWCSGARGTLDIARSALGAGGGLNSIHPRASGTNRRWRFLCSHVDIFALYIYIYICIGRARPPIIEPAISRDLAQKANDLITQNGTSDELWDLSLGHRPRFESDEFIEGIILMNLLETIAKRTLRLTFTFPKSGAVKFIGGATHILK